MHRGRLADAVAASLPGSLELLRIDGGYVGIVAPAKTPTPIVNRLHGEIKRALANTKTREFYVNGGYIPVDRSPAEFQKFLEAEVPRFRELGRIANIKLE